MRSRVKQSASVTAPLCLAITIMAVLILGLVEGARYYGLKADSEDITNLAAESLFAGYQPFLLKEYQMFFLDGGFGSEELDIAAAENEMNVLLYENMVAAESKDGIHLYRMDAADAAVTKYRLAADENGKVFELQAAKTMKKQIGRKAAEKILTKIQGIKEKENESENPQDYIKDANAALEGLAEQAPETSAGEADTGWPDAALEKTVQQEVNAAENPLDTVKTLKQQGILALVLPEGKTVSAKEISVDNCLMKRKCRQGNYPQKETTGWYERILMQEFIKPLAGNAVSPKEGGALSYGTEYLICGKGSDIGNLKGTVNKLLLLREAANFLYLQTDEAKKAEALAAATAIAGASVNPAVIAAVKQGILAAWAYVESLCDVKALLSDGKIPLIKNAGNWKSELSKLSEALGADLAGESEGLSYENYLDALLYGKTVKQIAYRSMDIMEWHMQKDATYTDCRMDNMIVGLKITAEYEAETLFFGLFGENADFSWRFFEQAEYIYES